MMKSITPLSTQRCVLRHAIATAILSSAASTSVYAQEDSTTQEIEEVFVTGSRIARDPNLGASSPVQSLSGEDIKLSGELSVIETLNDIPALLTSTTAESSAEAGIVDGQNTLDLRGLGPERTLVLVNGKRHVAGIEGSASVDVGSIPDKLIERVEVLTGGASAVYGSDAVSGVVNFILKRNYEGFEVNLQGGMSSESDAQQFTASAIYGVNFDDDRGNLTLALDYKKDEGLRARERGNGLEIGSARDWTNPALRFQQGDISSATPNFEEYFNYGNTGLFRYGLTIPSQDDFIAEYTDAFGAAPELNSAEIALFDRADNAAPRAVLPFRTFPFTSGYGYIIPGNPYSFDGFDPETNIDLDNNGRLDCLDSFSGYNSVFGDASFGVLGGCWNVEADGTYRPIRDGLVAGNFEGFGGDSYNTIRQQETWLILPDDTVNFNALGSYEFSSALRFYGEFKYVVQETENTVQPTAFWDLLFGAPDNPYLPEFIQPVADATGGVAITADPIGIGAGTTETKRETTRLVLSLEGDFGNDWRYEAFINHGVFDRETTGNEDLVVVDRFLAAIDAVSGENGEPDCRVNVDPSTEQVTTPFDIPVYDPGYYSFTPGDDTCVPLNIWAGATGLSQDAVDWITRDSSTEVKIEQTVVGGLLSGTTDGWLELPAGPIGLAFGAEYRDESSKATFDSWRLGQIPEGAPFDAGTLVEDVSSNSSLVFRPITKTANSDAGYDVYETFVEAILPLLDEVPGANSLSLELAARYADYSTVGGTSAFKANLVYAPINDLTFRLSQSRAVRAPNLAELFGPLEGTTFRPTDVCNASENLSAQTQANCVEFFQGIGFDPFDDAGNYVYTDPLSASFGGVVGGNPELIQETSDSTTIGFVYNSSMIDGLTFSLDYWDIEIDDAVRAVTDDDIVRGCYLGPSLNPNFCDLQERNSDPSSAQFGGLSFIRSVDINFAKLETAGFDFSAAYNFNIGDHNLDARVAGTRVHKIDLFTDPTDLSAVNPELKEVQRPELAGNVYLTWTLADLSLSWQGQYQSEQLLRFVEIEEFEDGDYDSSVMQDAVWLHDLSGSFDISDQWMLYGGVRNVTDEAPFTTNISYPASPRGRFFYFGVDYKI